MTILTLTTLTILTQVDSVGERFVPSGQRRRQNHIPDLGDRFDSGHCPDSGPRRDFATLGQHTESTDTPNFPSRMPQNRFKPLRGIIASPGAEKRAQNALKREIKIQRILCPEIRCYWTACILQDFPCNPGAGFGVGKGVVVVLHAETTSLGNCRELMVR